MSSLAPRDVLVGLLAVQRRLIDADELNSALLSRTPRSPSRRGRERRPPEPTTGAADRRPCRTGPSATPGCRVTPRAAWA